MVLLAAWCGPRFGELTELRRKDITVAYNNDGEPDAGILHISRAITWPDPDTPIVKEPKTAAGVRDVEIPPHLCRSSSTTSTSGPLRVTTDRSSPLWSPPATT